MPQRVSSNITIVESYLTKQGYIKKIDTALAKKYSVENISFTNYLSSDHEMISFKKITNIDKIIFHFGNTEKYYKTLNEKKIKHIIKIYRYKYPDAKFSIIYGPSETEKNHDFTSLFDEAITDKKISEFLNQAFNYDLCVCNDTGIGHILSQNGIRVDLCINSNANVFLHKIMCKNTNQIIITSQHLNGYTILSEQSFLHFLTFIIFSFHHQLAYHYYHLN